MTPTTQQRIKQAPLLQWLLKKQAGVFALSTLMLMLALAVLAPTIAHTPGEASNNALLIPFNPGDIDTFAGAYQPPFTKGHAIHWLGTDNIGRDVAAILVHGTRSSLFIAIAAAILSTLIGVSAGALAGFFSDRSLYISVGKAVIALVSLLSAGFWGIYVRRFKIIDAMDSNALLLQELTLSLLIIAGILLFTYWLTRLFKVKAGLKKVYLPIDAFMLTWMDLTVSIPALILVICLLALMQPSSYLIIAIIGLTTWPGTARLLRSEVIYIKQSTFVQSARTTGLPKYYILWRHVLPNALTPVYAAFAFSASNALLIESGLSFLHIGTTADLPGWGALIAQVVAYPSAWHLALFPGAMLFLVITSLNTLGELLQQYFNPKHRVL